jgi:cytochrome P450
MALPPGPELLPMLQTFQWMRRPTQFLDECHARFGDTFTIRFAGLQQAIVILADPAAIREVFAAGHEAMHAGEANVFLGPFLGKNSLLLLDDEEHVRQRKLLLPPFHGERMQAYGREMIAQTDLAIDRWKVGEAFPIHPEFRSITLQIILRTVFGMEEGERRRKLSTLLADALDIVEDPSLLMPFMQVDLGRFSAWGRYQIFARQIDEIIMSVIDERRRDPHANAHTDILSMLLAARDEQGAPMTDEELRDELITLLVAGHETTATALAWTFRWLLECRGVLDRIVEDIEAHDAQGAPERIAKLDLLDRTVRESLRLQPIIPVVGRILRRPMLISGHDLPSGTMVAPAILLVHRRPSLYPNPKVFDPDRFLKFKPSPSEWFPFGGGNRRCIGMAFALHEMKMVVATVLARTTMKLAPGAGVAIKRRAITLTPPEGLPVIVTDRRPAHEGARAA